MSAAEQGSPLEKEWNEFKIFSYFALESKPLNTYKSVFYTDK